MNEEQMITDEHPTERIPVVPVDPDDSVDDPFVDEGWAQPRRTSRLTIGLVAAVLVAAGFLLGVTVEKFAASTPARERTTTQQPATTPARTATP